MNQFREDAARDDSFSEDLLPIVSMATMGLSVVILIVEFWVNELGHGVWLFPLALMLAVHLANVARNNGKLRRAGKILAWTFAVLPALTVPMYGLHGNPLVFISALGLIVAALAVSIRVAASLAGAVFLLLIAEACALGAGLAGSAIWLSVVSLLLIGTLALSAGAATAIRDTIAWALDAGAKSNRRENLLRTTQAELQAAIYERDRLNARLQSLNQDLEAARIAAEVAYRAKASFMATLSHELATSPDLTSGLRPRIGAH